MDKPFASDTHDRSLSWLHVVVCFGVGTILAALEFHPWHIVWFGIGSLDALIHCVRLVCNR